MKQKLHINVLKPSDEQLNTLFEHYQTGRLDDAEKLSISITQEFPEHPFAWKVFGAALKRMGKINESLVVCQKSVQLEPQDAEANSNLGVILQELGRLEESETNYKKAIELKPDYVQAHNNLGTTQQELGRIDEAEASLRQALKLKPDYASALYNLGNILKEQGRLDEAETNYKKVIELKPDFIEAHNNLGTTQQKLGKLDEAEASLRQALKLKPDYVFAHNNLGNLLNNSGDVVSAINSYKQALNIQPDYVPSWVGIFYPLKVINLQIPSIKNHLPLLNEEVSSKYAKVLKSILNYRLNQGSPSSGKFLKEALKVLSSADNTFIKNPKLTSNELIKPTLPEKITALVHFGRSGTGLMHSLIDWHPEISTLPSNYFSEFFDHNNWKKITIGGWEEIVDRFVKTYEVLFDASSSVKIATIGYEFNYNVGKKEGMTNVGPERNEVLSVDKKVFVKELKQFMKCYDELDVLTFLKLVHSAYEVAMENPNEKKLIFYHIHNPDTYAQLNFLRLVPNTNWLMMVREPLQSCESWISKNFHDNDYNQISIKIFQMLFQVDQSIYQNENSVGVKLEDLKKYPKKTIPALCKWLGIKENDSLYEMTAQGKRWWGDPSGKNYKKDGMDPFGKSSINRKLGSVFSENDQYILRTLFYPFSVRFGYAEENLEKFKNDLQTIRSMLDQMFDFEKKIVQNKKMNTEKFIQSGYYLYLRSGMIERWNTLSKFNTYPKMLTPLKIN